MSAVTLTSRGNTRITYTLTVANSGPNDASNVVLTGNVPAGTTFYSATGNPNLTPTVGGVGAVEWEPALLDGDSKQVQLTVTVNRGKAAAIRNDADVVASSTD